MRVRILGHWWQWLGLIIVLVSGMTLHLDFYARYPLFGALPFWPNPIPFPQSFLVILALVVGLFFLQLRGRGKVVIFLSSKGTNRSKR